MKHTVTLTEKDYLTYQLYEYSTNPLRTFKRKRDYLVLVVLGVVFTSASYSSSDQVVFYITAFLTATWILFGKNYLRWRYKKHFAKHVKNTYKDALERQVQIEITEDTIITTDKIGVNTIKISEVKQVSEIPDHFLIIISTGEALIVPKQSAELNQDIVAMAKREHILSLNEMYWKWH